MGAWESDGNELTPKPREPVLVPRRVLLAALALIGCGGSSGKPPQAPPPPEVPPPQPPAPQDVAPQPAPTDVPPQVAPQPPPQDVPPQAPPVPPKSR